MSQVDTSTQKHPTHRWSLGILLYEMVTGLPPFYSENVNDMYELILVCNKAPSGSLEYRNNMWKIKGPIAFHILIISYSFTSYCHHTTQQRKPLNFTDESSQGMSEAAKSICTKMLERDPDERMQEIDDFKNHPFFADMQWDKMMAKALPVCPPPPPPSPPSPSPFPSPCPIITPHQVPFKPDPSKLHFDDEFTSEPARHSMAKAGNGGGGNCENFKNFTYVGKK